jgi:hypothetical protein
MKMHLKASVLVLAGVCLSAASGLRLNAQIINAIQAHIAHSFIAGETNLPPGGYTFRIEPGSDIGVMTIQNGKGDNVAQFNVRQSLDNHLPKRSELVFKKYGNAEFLSKVYEGGSKSGVAVIETSAEEKRLVSQGQHGIEHTEEQP